MADYCHSGGSSTVSSSTGSCLSSFRPPVAMGGYPHHRLHRHHGSHPTLLRITAPAVAATTTSSATTATGGDADDDGVRPHSVSMTTAAAAKALGTMVIDHRVRIVRLNRPPYHSAVGHHHAHLGGGGTGTGGATTTGSNFGFSIRGGLEYGTGFFVSAVENDSEADRQGLKVGDQIVRVNGYQVDDAVHRELAHFVANQERLVLKVRSVGIIPVKEHSADALTWHVVSFNGASVVSSGSSSSLPRVERTSCSSSTTSSTGSGTVEELPAMAGSGRELKVTLSVTPRTKLGCGICKGPDWRPGIFVQFTKEGGVAREAGLRPGDQIMSCNGREFAEITFAEAVSIMKASSVLELMVRPGAGIDMFPGESSGYNSSASSVNGDSSPCWGDSTAKRLSIVREESISNDRRAKLGSKGVTNGRRNNTTIIEFSENGTVINNSNSLDKKQLNGEKNNSNNGKGDSKKLADICFVSKQSETKTIIVEVHRSASTNSIHTGSPPPSSGSVSIIPPPPPLFADKIPPPPPLNSCGLSSGYSTTNSAKSSSAGSRQQQRSPSAVSLADSSASSGIDCGGLGSAISEELKRRAQKKGTSLSSALEPAAALTELENRLKEKRFRPPNSGGSDAARHCALMDEFKAVHKRMFKNGFDNAELKKSPSKDKLPTDDVAPPAAAGSTPATKGTMGRVAATELAKANGDVAELESIESFKMTNPAPTPVRPPSYYFCPQNTGPQTTKKTLKPIAVTISEYEPVKSCNRFDMADVNAASTGSNASCSIGRLRSELEKTLSMSNLRLRCESRENLVEHVQIASPQEQIKLNRSSSVANGVGRIGSSQPTASSGNRITIAISGSAMDRK